MDFPFHEPISTIGAPGGHSLASRNSSSPSASVNHPSILAAVSRARSRRPVIDAILLYKHSLTTEALFERVNPRVTVGIVTRNRPASLRRCVESIVLLGDLVAEVVIVDDTSDPPARESLGPLPPAIGDRTRFIRQHANEGYIVARNATVRAAQTEYVILMDDDACFLDGASIRTIVDLMQRDRRVAAVACAMAEVDGSPWDARMQPSPVSYLCYVPAFIGFAHLLRRAVFLDLGGYRESFRYYGEEKDYCRRLLAAHYDVVYAPSARVTHAPDPAGRDPARYLRYVTRNDCLCALYNDPLAIVCATTAMRLAAYFQMRRGWQVDDPGGFLWVVREVIAQFPAVLRGRTPMTLSDVRRWRALRRISPPYRRSDQPADEARLQGA